MARKLILGTYDTILNGPWTLSALELTAAQQRTQFVEVPGRDGELDLSAALTDGAPRYGNRTLTATLERSDGTRMDREYAINTMVNWLDGWRMDVRLPDVLAALHRAGLAVRSIREKEEWRCICAGRRS